MMKDRFERFVVLPFSIGCSSESSVAVASSSSSSQHQTSKKPKSDQEAQPSGTRRERGENVNSEERTRTSYLPSFFYGVHKVIVGSFKSLSQIFVYKEEIEEVEIEMEIGFPTDVKHVTHIGLDGSTTTNPVKGWDNLVSSEILTFPSLSLRQFELAMANQVDAPFIVDSSKFKTNKPTNY